MRTIRITAALFLILAIVFLAGCRDAEPSETTGVGTKTPTSETATEPETETQTEPVSETETETETQTVPTEPEPVPEPEPEPEPEPDPVPEPEPEPQTTAAPQTEPAVAKTEPIGYTSKGFPIEVRNGCTYIGGLLIANKTYSLPSWYDPGGMTSDCAAAFYSMCSAASAEGIGFYSISDYRSYSLQEWLYQTYVNRDGKEAADTFSAHPGHSEHQTGLAIDVNSTTQSFADTAEGKWLAAHCWEYGFIIRYPQGKEWSTGFIYEPWHIRYVGTWLSIPLRDSGLTLEEYLGIDSVYN